MSTRRANTLLFCFMVLALNSTAASRQTTFYDTTPTGSDSIQHYAPPTPTTPIVISKYSRNDPFRIFAPPSDPVCCLIPLPSAQPDPHPTDDLLPFEEWKQRQLALTSAEEPRHTETGTTATPTIATSDEHAPVPETTSNILVPVIDTSDAPPVRPVGAFVPIEGRYNYAALDCSARVHGFHKSMKSTTSILSSKKDKYLLAPCSAEKKYVVVELCDEIRVDTVQLANFEFFSGVFKDITITLSRTANIDPAGSEIIGVYEAKNVRSVQTFRPFNRPHAFYRFIRIDFRTHYGKEYFCPVVLEKRLGIAQLGLLTIVLVFMALTRGSRAETHLLGSVRRRVDSGVGLARSLYPRTRTQSRPRANERPFAWARQDRRSTGDISHQDSGEPPLTPVRPRSPLQTAGTPSGFRGRKISGTRARSPTGQSSRGVRFPQGLYPFPSSRPGNPIAGMRRSQSMSLSTDHLAPSPGMGKRPATGMKRLARTAHLHEVEVEAQRRRRIQAESTSGDNDTSSWESQPTANALAQSADQDLIQSDDVASDNPADHDPSVPRQDPLNTETLSQAQLAQQLEKEDGTDWEDTDVEAEDSGQELVVEDIPAPRVPRLFSPPTPGTWGARRKARGFSVDTGTALRLQCA
ncbi:hypothetical protein FRC08_011017 [Ceratobasidium sp. 394]|nr:hypothetical protein FRC08_011017 [Ceratobasidium sp. 394]